jgi:hypothetical protein
VELDAPLVEAPVLESERGWAVTLLNWSDQRLARLRVRIRPGFAVARVATRDRDVRFTNAGDGSIELSVPLQGVEVLRVYRA